MNLPMSFHFLWGRMILEKLSFPGQEQGSRPKSLATPLIENWASFWSMEYCIFLGMTIKMKRKGKKCEAKRKKSFPVLIWGVRVSKMPGKKLVDSFSFALDGIREAFKSERNLKIHVIIGLIVLLSAFFLGLSRIEFIVLLFAISLVLVMELFNTVVEKIIDLVSPNYHPRARIIKNIAAGAVFISAVNAVIIGFFIFYNRIDEVSPRLFNWLLEQPAYLTFLLVLFLILLLFVIKYKQNRSFSLQGGMPSLHSALAFSLATVIAFGNENFLIVFLGYSLAFLVAQSRIEGRIHKFSEVFWGALLGVLLTTLVFQFFAGGQ